MPFSFENPYTFIAFMLGLIIVCIVRLFIKPKPIKVIDVNKLSPEELKEKLDKYKD